MNSKSFKSAVSVLLSLVMIFSCFGVLSSAASVTIVRQPNRTTLYQGIDWSYSRSNEISIIGGNVDLTGTILSYNSERVEYAVNLWPNMYSKSESGSWRPGNNTIQIFCDEFPSNVYATTTIKLVSVESISIVSPPAKTILMQDTDWKLSRLGDVEFTEFDLSGLKLNVKYTDGTVKTVSYPSNQLIGWAVPQDVDFLEPGEATIYATFGGKRAPFKVIFAEKNARIPGDLNRDFKINSLDALMVLQSAVGLINLDSAQTVQADVSKDGAINSYDALMILQYAVGQLSSLY